MNITVQLEVFDVETKETLLRNPEMDFKSWVTFRCTESKLENKMQRLLNYLGCRKTDAKEVIKEINRYEYLDLYITNPEKVISKNRYNKIISTLDSDEWNQSNIGFVFVLQFS